MHLQQDTQTILLDWELFKHDEMATLGTHFHQTLQSILGINVIETMVGADRTQIFFRFDEEDYILHLEQLCEAAWIEKLSGHPQSLENLYQHLCHNTLIR
ncbi:DUF3630 family protein [Aestuariibacter salexigens]|uniref:DUF3630 family protein n=1 Tax=Aestuariibacter salexigens TaxID=226010 RepID=UPI0004008C1B|nr:DUF3630 family protein [Aestuariibacter salexigens]